VLDIEVVQHRNGHMTEGRLFNFAKNPELCCSIAFCLSPSFSDLLTAKLKAIQSPLACPKCPLTQVPGRKPLQNLFLVI
jgi:hypothetical protein